MKFNDSIRVNSNGNILTINVFKDIPSSEFRLYLLSTYGFDIYKDSIILPNVITKYSSFVFSSVSHSINTAYMRINGSKEELVIKDTDSSLKVRKCIFKDSHDRIPIINKEGKAVGILYEVDLLDEILNNGKISI